MGRTWCIMVSDANASGVRGDIRHVGTRHVGIRHHMASRHKTSHDM